LQITTELMLSELAFAEDAALGSNNTQEASDRITKLSEGAKEAGMEVSVPKEKCSISLTDQRLHPQRKKISQICQM
jgi:hypothetical protein